MSSNRSRLETCDPVLRLAAQGDPEAFTQLYRRYRPVVYNIGRALTGCPSAAEDLTQETFVALFVDLSRYDPHRASFTTYLYGIVRNLSRHRVRHECRLVSLDALNAHDERTSYRADLWDGIHHARLATNVRLALRRLPARYRELIVLCDMHGRSYAEAAQIAGVSLPTVRWRLHRGRQLLRGLLSGGGRRDTPRA